MARKQRIEVDGGPYHLITRVNNRLDIFHSHEDRLKSLLLMAVQKSRSFYCFQVFCLRSRVFASVRVPTPNASKD